MSWLQIVSTLILLYNHPHQSHKRINKIFKRPDVIYIIPIAIQI